MIKEIFRRKTISQIQAEAGQSELKRTLGPWNLLSLGIGCIIGAGIFVMTGQAAAAHAGPALMLSFVLTGIACIFVGLCYAELASLLPVSGSAYTYAYATLGEFFAWTIGCLLVLEYGVAAATVAVGWSGYLNSFLLSFGVVLPPQLTTAMGEPVMVSEVYRSFVEQAGYIVREGQVFSSDGQTALTGILNLPASIGILLVTALLITGIKESARVNNIIVLVKVAVVIAFIIIGAFYIDVNNWVPFIPENQGPGRYGVDGIIRAASIVFFAYVGFEAVSTTAQEAKNPQKDVPFGMIGALLVCTVLYILVSAVLTGIVPYQKLGVPDPMALAVDTIGLGWFAFLIKVGAIMGLSSVMLVLLYGQTRIFYVMGRDGLLPSFFAKIHDKFKTPALNTIVVGCVVAIASGITPIHVLGDLVSLGTLLAFMIVCFSVLYLRRKQPDLVRAFKTPFVPLVPIIGILMCGYLAFQVPVAIFIKLKIFFVGGVILYFFYGRKKSVLRNTVSE